MIDKLFSFCCAAATVVAAVAPPALAADELEAKLQSCHACHGATGPPVDAIIPIIWGQQQAYLVKQLHDYRTEDRANPVMSPIAGTIKPEEWRKAAAYFAAKSWPVRSAATPAAAAPAPSADKIAVCKACHQENFVGAMSGPRLAGQSYDYLIAAMNSFAEGTRANSADMATMMKALSPADRQAIARYLSGL